MRKLHWFLLGGIIVGLLVLYFYNDLYLIYKDFNEFGKTKVNEMTVKQLRGEIYLWSFISGAVIYFCFIREKLVKIKKQIKECQKKT